MSQTFRSYLLTIVGAEYVMGYLPIGTHDWKQYRSPEQVAELLLPFQMDPLDSTGMVLARPPLLGNWEWRLNPSDTKVNWIGTYRRS